MRVQLDEGAYLPERAHSVDAGVDLKTPTRVVLRAHDSVVIDTGVHVEIPHGCAGLLVSKSGLNTKCDITSTGLIDEGYTGSIAVKLYNHGGQMKIFERGDKISQLVIIPVRYENIEQVDVISGGERGDNGFGSTGV